MPCTPCSIVITCYNLERYIDEAIQSVLNQQSTSEVDIIVVDDCSTDGSARVIKNFPTVRYLCTPNNSGVLIAMLHGIEMAQHDIVYLLDGDDIWEPEKLRLAGAAFGEDPSLGFLTHDLNFIDGNGNEIARTSRPGKVLGTISTAELSDAVRHSILALTDYVWLGSAIGLRRSVINFAEFAVWARSLPDPRNVYQDWPLAYWAAAQLDVRLGYIDSKLFRYRLHGANHSGDARSVDKALRNVRRTLNTSEAMGEIARAWHLAPHYCRITARQVRFYRYLVDLYQNRRVAAAGGFIAALPFLIRQPRLLAKEATRLLLVGTMGVRRFAAWQASR